MNSVERLCAFEDVIKICKSQEQLIGTRNPLAPHAKTMEASFMTACYRRGRWSLGLRAGN